MSAGDAASFEAPSVTLPRQLVIRCIWWAVGVLIVATFVAQFAIDAWDKNNIVDLFDSDQKVNFPTAMKVLLLLSATALLAGLGISNRDRWPRHRWFGMSVVFALLTLDEMTYMHQRLSDGMHVVFDTSGPLRFAWEVVYLPFVAALAVVYLPFWRQLANPLRTRLLLAAIGFAGGSGGIEVIKSVLKDDDHWKLSFGLVASLSDSLELLGLALLVTALLTTLGDSNPIIILNFGP